MKLKLSGILMIILAFLSFGVFANQSGTGTALDLEGQVRALPGVGFQYQGQRVISQDDVNLLIRQVENQRSSSLLNMRNPNCPERQANVAATPNPATLGSGTGSGRDDHWEVVFLARIGLRSDMTGGSTPISPLQAGINRYQSDYTEIERLHRAGELTTERLDQIFRASGEALGHDSQAAMAYVSSLGQRLNDNYGDSNAGTFIPRIEQYGRLVDGGSVGQCSDIHFAMLKAYKQMVGPNAKAYLVNYQTAGRLHHTNMIVENENGLFIIDYGDISRQNPGQADLLAQPIRPGHGLAYRIFTDDGEIDQMVAHIDTPLGRLLREVSTGRSSYNPFESSNYTLISAGLEHSSNGHVKIFFGEIGNGDAVMGVALNYRGVAELPAGFTLEGYISGALSYAHRNFQVRNSRESLHSAILYINTGLGVISPKLELGGFSFQARTDIVLEGGAWFKHFSDGNEKNKPFEADGNLISRTRVDMGVQVTRNFRIEANAEIELVPTFRTAFPSSTDGSSGVDGLGQTLGVMANRITVGGRFIYTTPQGVDLFAGLTYQHTGLGPVGEVRVGARTDIFQASAFLRGAIDRNETPIFIPGARREIGFSADLCSRESGRGPSSMCIGGTYTHSLEDSTWSGFLTGTVRW